MQRPWGACRCPAAARSCGPACRGEAPGERGEGEEGCQRWGRSSAEAWEAGRVRVMPRRMTPRGGRTETGSLTDRDSSPASGVPSGLTHKQETGRGWGAGLGFGFAQCDQDASQEGNDAGGVMRRVRGAEKESDRRETPASGCIQTDYSKCWECSSVTSVVHVQGWDFLKQP